MSEEQTNEFSEWVKCDRCSAQAFVAAKLLSGELYFCGHHFSKYESNLNEHAYEIIDNRSLINKKVESSA